MTASFADGRSTSLRLAFTYGDRTLLGDVVFPAAVAEQHVAQQTTEVVLVRFAVGADPTSAAPGGHRRLGGFGHPRVQDRQQFLDSQGAQVDVLLRVIYALLGVAILIAGMGIANTLSLSIHERTRELGLLRAIGQSRRQLRAMVRWESVIVATFGAVGGVGLGIFLGWGMVRALAASEGFGTFALPVVPLAVIVLLGAGLGVLAARPSCTPGGAPRRARGDRHRLISAPSAWLPPVTWDAGLHRRELQAGCTYDGCGAAGCPTMGHRSLRKWQYLVASHVARLWERCFTVPSQGPTPAEAIRRVEA